MQGSDLGRPGCDQASGTWPYAGGAYRSYDNVVMPLPGVNCGSR
jgi:hypothetical protein